MHEGDDFPAYSPDSTETQRASPKRQRDPFQIERFLRLSFQLAGARWGMSWNEPRGPLIPC